MKNLGRSEVLDEVGHLGRSGDRQNLLWGLGLRGLGLWGLWLRGLGLESLGSRDEESLASQSGADASKIVRRAFRVDVNPAPSSRWHDYPAPGSEQDYVLLKFVWSFRT